MLLPNVGSEGFGIWTSTVWREKWGERPREGLGRKQGAQPCGQVHTPPHPQGTTGAAATRKSAVCSMRPGPGQLLRLEGGQGQDGRARAGTPHQRTAVTARSWACLLTFEKSYILDLERRGTEIQVRTAGCCLPSAHTHALRRSSSSSLGTEAPCVLCVRLKHFNLLRTDVEGVPWFSVTQFSHLFSF